MATTNEIRNRVIDSLMTINDSDYLKALEKMIKSSNVEDSNINLTEEQKIMLAMSDEDIKSRDLIDQNSLNEQELESWATLGFSAGIVFCFADASKKPEGAFFPFRCERISYQGAESRKWEN